MRHPRNPIPVGKTAVSVPPLLDMRIDDAEAVAFDASKSNVVVL